MKAGFLTFHDISNIAGRPANEIGHLLNARHAAKALANQSISIDYLGPLKTRCTKFSLLKQKAYKLFLGTRYLRHVEPGLLKEYAKEIQEKIRNRDLDLIIGNMSRQFAYLNTDVPLVAWRDATFAGAVEVHRDFNNLCAESLRHGHAMERAALHRCRLAIFHSDWAAGQAINIYDVPPEKVAVVPIGGNQEHNYSETEIRDMIRSRAHSTCNLLFMGVDWAGKGGDMAVEVATRLNSSGMAVHLTLVGSSPPDRGALPDYVLCEGFVNTGTPEGMSKLHKLMSQTHFLILPTKGDACPNVLPESNSFGIPCLTSDVGGIPSIIRNDINGRMFSRDSDADSYCSYIIEIFSGINRYRELALTSLNEYNKRLRWDVVGKKVKELLDEVLP